MEGKAAFGTLCFYCSFLRGGYSLLASPHAYSADVTGGNVVIDGTPAHPIPAAPIAGGAITNASDNGNVHDNTLTVSSVDFAGMNFYGGYTFGTGNAADNKIVLSNIGVLSNHVQLYGGWSEQGNAINNTITLNGTGDTPTTYAPYNYANLHGGGGSNTSKDHKTGNTLKVIAKDNGINSFDNFEKMEFGLNSGIASGDTMLHVRNASGTPQTFEWSKISVTLRPPPDRECRRLRIRYICKRHARIGDDDERDRDQARGQ